jgi:hypothetical protein
VEKRRRQPPAPLRFLSQPIGSPIIPEPMENRQNPRDVEPSRPDNDNPVGEKKPDPDALARDDLPEDERIEQQNDLA